MAGNGAVDSPGRVPAALPWEFSHVELTSDNATLPLARLEPANTPSARDGLSPAAEDALRWLGCETMQHAAILLRVPHVAVATAQVLFQRFFYVKSFTKHHWEHFAMACINLAAKIEEGPRRIRDVINVFHRVRLERDGRRLAPLVLDGAYIGQKNQVIKAERRVLKELGFCVHVKHPHKLIVVFLKLLGQHSNRRLVQCSWNYMNDSFRTDTFCRHQPEVVAAGCISLAARHLQVALPHRWMQLFDVAESAADAVALQLLRLYARPAPQLAVAEAAVHSIRRAQLDAKNQRSAGGGGGAASGGTVGTGAGLEAGGSSATGGAASPGGGAATTAMAAVEAQDGGAGRRARSRSRSRGTPKAYRQRRRSRSSGAGVNSGPAVSSGGSRHRHHRHQHEKRRHHKAAPGHGGAGGASSTLSRGRSRSRDRELRKESHRKSSASNGGTGGGHRLDKHRR